MKGLENPYDALKRIFHHLSGIEMLVETANFEFWRETAAIFENGSSEKNSVARIEFRTL